MKKKIRGPIPANLQQSLFRWRRLQPLAHAAWHDFPPTRVEISNRVRCTDRPRDRFCDRANFRTQNERHLYQEEEEGRVKREREEESPFCPLFVPLYFGDILGTFF